MLSNGSAQAESLTGAAQQRRQDVGVFLVWRQWGAKEEGCTKESYTGFTAAAGHVTEARKALGESDGEAAGDSKRKCINE